MTFSGLLCARLKPMSCITTFFHRVILYAVSSGRTLRRKLAMPSRAGRLNIHVGVRWSMVTFAARFAIEGTMVTAVAPDPITTTFLPS